MELVRLNKYIKDLGLCSRRKADEFIKKGYIVVNGKIITELGFKINPILDKVIISDLVEEEKSQFRYILLNKPKGFVCSKSQAEGNNIFSLLPPITGLTYAGRLDKDSYGLILLSNDGKFVYTIAGSEFALEKEYIVRVNKPITAEYLNQQANASIILDGKRVKKATVSPLGEKVYKITLTEGINRQIRRMAENQGYTVVDLKRIRIGTLQDRELKLGSWRDLTAAEIAQLTNHKCTS
jgi:23S rRNA pseudouridine2604 synthase